ncbi:MAG: metallophosphoesterase family protein [Clostridiales bacterium]|nr:metallophosphoesterase family protein [Clostridiales bacterium]
MKMLKKSLCALLCLIMLVSLCAQSFSAAQEGTTPRRISVTVNGDPTSSRGLCWYTDVKSASLAEFYTNALLTGEPISVTSSEATEWEGAYMHKLTVTGLEAGVTYYYRVGDGTNWSEVGTFRTDDGDASVKFIAVADVQASSLENFEKGADTLRAAFRTMPDADFVANCGDFTNDSTNEEWDYYDQAFAQMNLASTLVPVAGNHDGLGVWHWFDNMFNLDTSESVQTLNGVNYSFDYGNAHFAVLNTNDILSISDAQIQWLKNDMNSTSKDWKIVFMHKSPYTLGKDGKWPDALYLQDALAAACDEVNVDLVMSGHDHMYLRTKPLTGNAVSEDGTVYVLAGTAGSKRYEIRSFLGDTFLQTEFIDALAVQKNGYGNYWNGKNWHSKSDTNIGGCFNCISIDGGTLTLKAYILADAKDENGNDVITNVDTYSVTKAVGENQSSFEGDNSTGELDFYTGAVTSFGSLAAYTLTSWLPKFFSILPEILRVYIKFGTF